MVKIEIPNKIVDEQLLNGEKITIQFFTTFNQTFIEKIFPDDFTPEEQQVFKNVYELAVYGSEVGKNIFRCFNSGKNINISGYKRTEPNETSVVDFAPEKLIKLQFTRHGIGNKSVEIKNNLGSTFTQQQLDELIQIGITIQGTTGQFDVIDYDGDIAIEIIKDAEDSFIDLGGFQNGRIVFIK